MDLRSATMWLVRNPDPARWLRLVDSYTQSFAKLTEDFVVPAEHAHLQPIVESFANDVAAFGNYIRALRDGADGSVYDSLHELYRTVSMRAIQQERRARIRRAVDILERKLQALGVSDLGYEEQVRLARLVEHRWGGLRLEHMAAARRLRKSSRLTTEDRSVEVDRFWFNVDRHLRQSVVVGVEDFEEVKKELRL